jgi:TRAP-type C4-dicarboxylate transport system permease small subunit
MAISTVMTPPLCISARIFRFEEKVYGVEKMICIAALAVMLVAISTSVLVRYFNLPMPNLSEWGIVAMAPLTFIGMAMCSYTGTHIAVDVIKSVKSAQIQRAARFATGLASVIFATVYLYSGWIFFDGMLESGEKMMDMGTPVAFPLFFLPAGMALVLFHAVLELWRTVRDLEPVTEEQA